MKSWLTRSARVEELEKRVRVLEQDVVELRRHNLRLAELTDVVEELLVPLASRDDAAASAAIEKFTKSL
ncbi:DUF6752 domain-containing protein [Nocardioides sp. DS6]|uniref:DUF6752 domain-containing protein n=1 Tax=Nocardioides eburneus TaxID=3231482 RepID=A0ABV3T2J4_9ACTN